MTDLKPDNGASLKFLKRWSPNGPWVLTAIQIDRKAISTKTFQKDQEQDVLKWLQEYNGHRNIYFHVNSVNRNLSSKANKEDIKSADWLHVDIDPQKGEDLTQARERALGLLTDRLPKDLPKPTVIIFSGGGYQAFWKLKEPVIVDGDIKKCEDFERYNQRLEQIFDGDHCHNIDRIMRLPGTINLPNAKKQKEGRVPELAVLFEFNNSKYDLSDFKPVVAVQNKTGDHQGGAYGIEVSIPGNIERIIDIHELDEWSVSDREKIIIVQGKHPDQPKDKDNSRSSWLFDCVCNLLRRGVPDEVVFSIITDPSWGISESVIEAKPNAEKYAIKQIKSAKEFIIDPELVRMNAKHAIIGNIGGKCRVIEEIDDDVLNRSRLTLSSFEDLRNRYSNKKVKIGTDKDGDPIYKPLGKWWIDHPMRRQFDTIKFLPNGDKEGVYNLWRGFAVQPLPGNCDLYLEHLRKNVCSGVKEYYDYLIKWMARAVQFPGSQGEVAIVVRGGKGTGKGFFAREFGRLFGRHNLHISNPSHLVGNFNAHLRDVILLFADEAFYAGDKKHESVLKMLVTEDSIAIEAKGVDVEPYPNFVHLIIAANDPHVIRASGDERRYFVMNIAENNKQDTKYFDAIKKQMNEGGSEALLYYLQSIDLEGFQVRNVPQTDALYEQKILSMSVIEEWWFRKLKDGHILDHDTSWISDVPCEKIVNDFLNYAEKWKVNRRENETALGRFLNKSVPHLKRTQPLRSVEEQDEYGHSVSKKRRIYEYNFGSLEDCRKAWEKLNGEMQWPDIQSSSVEQTPDPF